MIECKECGSTDTVMFGNFTASPILAAVLDNPENHEYFCVWVLEVNGVTGRRHKTFATPEELANFMEERKKQHVH